MYFRSMETHGHVVGSTMSLGWAHNGTMNFIISGQPPRFDSTNPPLVYSWMAESRNLIGTRTLREIAMPGSHDSGMSTPGSKTEFAHVCNIVTQTQPIRGQLERGVRYFDIRPVISAGQFYTGHYSSINSTLGWQGGNGQSIQSVVNDVNSYLATSPELVVLRLSHDIDTDVGQPNYRPFNQHEYDQLMGLLTGSLKSLYADPTASDLTKIPIQQFIGPAHEKPKAALLVVADPSDSTVQIQQKYLNAGIHPASAYPVEDHYTGTQYLDKMAADQIAKMKQYRKSQDSTSFVLSWTLTQNSEAASACNYGLGPSIIDLANIANPSIYAELWHTLSPTVYPNILYTDNVNQTLNLELALAINSRAKNPVEVEVEALEAEALEAEAVSDRDEGNEH